MIRVVVVVLGLIMLVAAGALAAVTVRSISTITTGVTPAPVQFSAGAGATNMRYIANFALSMNKTSFSGTFLGKAGADIKVKDVVRATNGGPSSVVVTLRANQVVNPNVNVFTWTVKNGTMTVGTFDYLATTPSLTFTLPAGATYQLDERLKLAAGAGTNNASVPFTLGLSAT